MFVPEYVLKCVCVSEINFSSIAILNAFWDKVGLI